MKKFVLFTFSLVIAAFAHPLHAQSGRQLTVADIFQHGDPTGEPPKGIQWAPDGGRVTYIDNSNNDLMQLHAATGQLSVLVSHAKLSALAASHSMDERDKDHRARYHQASYLWAPDSKHLLFDSDGQLFLYSLDNRTAIDIASTGTGSGDDPKFSPNGQFISYVRDHNLYLHRFKEQTVEQPLTNTHEDTLLNGEVDWVYEEELDVRSNYFWSPDSARIAYLQMNEINVPQYPLVDWIPVHATTDHQRYPQPGDANPDVRVGVVRTQGGKTVWIKLPSESGVDSGGYIPRFGWVNPGTLWIETLPRDHKRRSIYFADAQLGGVRLAYTETDEKFFAESYNVQFTDGDFYLTSWRDGHTHIYRYSFDKNQPQSGGPTPLAHLEKQITSGDYEVGAIESVNDSANALYYISNEGNPLEQQVWSVKMDGTGKRQLSTKPGFHEPVFAPQSPTYVDTFSDRATPPAVSLCHAPECKAFWTSKPLQGIQLPTTESLELKAADNATTLYAELVLPADKTSPGTVPLIVNPYGGPGVQTVRNAWSAREGLFDYVLAAHGFAVLHVDNRGMAGRGRDFEQAAYRNFGPVQLSDQLAAIDRVLAKYPQLDKDRLGWWGWSWGGTFTLNALTHSDRFRAGVSVAPVTDWRNYDSIYTERYMSTPAENPSGYRDDSVVNSAKNLHGHLLLVHGTGDDNVHIANSIQFIQKLIDADIPYDFQVYPRKTHSIAGPEARTHLFSRILAHFELYLKNAPEAGKK